MRSVYFIILCLFLISIGLSAAAGTVGQAKAASDGEGVQFTGVVVYTEPAECYVEAADRSASIRVLGNAQEINIGESVDVSGTLTTIDGERVVTDATIALSSTEADTIAPFALNHKALAGATAGKPGLTDYSPARASWAPASGANNVGNLVKITGKVRAVYYSPTSDAKWFFIDDGSGVVADNGDTGVLVYSDADVIEKQYVAVTGIAGVEPAEDMPGSLIRVIRTRSADDVRMLAEARPDNIVIVDNFSNGTIDTPWVYYYSGFPSMINETYLPGWLTLDDSWGSTGLEGRLLLVRPASGDWDLEVKMQPDFVPNNLGAQEAGIVINSGLGNVLEVPVAYVVNSPYQSSLVHIAGQIAGSMVGDTIWFRLSRRNGNVSGQISYDGRNYSQVYSGIYADGIALGLYANRSSTSLHFKTYFDYFRLTKIMQ